MIPSVEALGEVVITSQAQGQMGARQQQINSTTLKNVVSADRLQQNPDANAIESIGRLPGITVDRSGGEGAGFKIRGLTSDYVNVTLNGESLPVGLNMVSSYALQGVEVYKSLTPNLEGNAVAGTVDLILKETPKGLHYNLMAQSGYNALNNDFKNYNFVGQISNRFLDDRLGVLLSLNAERTNRSVETMSAGYGEYSVNPEAPFVLSNINLNVTKRIIYKQSATLSLDFRASNSTTFNLYSFFSGNNTLTENQTKSYATNNGSANIGLNQTPNNGYIGNVNTLNGKTNLDFLNSTLIYGMTYSYNRSENPETRSWSYLIPGGQGRGLPRDSLTHNSPSYVAHYFDGILDNLKNTRLTAMGQDKSFSKSSGWSSHVDYEVPFKFGLFEGKIQMGGKYRFNKGMADITSGSQGVYNQAVFKKVIEDKLDWINDAFAISLDGSQLGPVKDFLGGEYSYGDYYSLDRSNEVYNTWDNTSNDLISQGEDVWLKQVSNNQPQLLGFTTNLSGSLLGDQDISQHYMAGYVMTEINIGRWVMLMPGFRYENTSAKMKGFQTEQPIYTEPVSIKMKGTYTSATREDNFWLPMMHIRVKPTKSFYIHFAYTHTLKRPDFGYLTPNKFVNNQQASASKVYIAGNPALKTELWKSYDLQFTYHNPKIGLFSVTGFNKTVEDKIWARTYKRIPGDPIPPDPNFRNNDIVSMTVYENHPYKINLKGFELEWQTSFWYLPKPFSFFTLNTNYTYTKGESPNPYTYLTDVLVGRDLKKVRTDSVIIQPMTGQPKHMGNVTLGVKVKSFQGYLSYQVASEKIESVDATNMRKYTIRELYDRWDVNVSYGFKLNEKGQLEILATVANLSNSEDITRYRGDIRPIVVEKYGMTANIGARYKF